MARFTAVPHSRLRALNARTMHDALQETAQATLHVDAVAGPLVRLRDETVNGRAVSVEAAVARAAVLALQAHPHVNARIGVDGLTMYHAINLGVMVALEKGVIVPVVEDAGALSLHDLDAAIRSVTEKTQSGTLTPNETRWPTFTIASFADYAVDHSTPILVTGMVATLALGRVRAVCEPADGGSRTGHRVALSLTFDHRAIHGVDAARFLTTLTDRLAAPGELA